jgi:signal recognition particle GTPase
MGFFDSFVTVSPARSSSSSTGFEEIVQKPMPTRQRSRPIDVDTIEALEELLVSADVGIPATERIVTAVKARARHGESLRDLVKRRSLPCSTTCRNRPPTAIVRM